MARKQTQMAFSLNAECTKCYNFSRARSVIQPTWKIASDERGEVADEANDQSKAKVAAAARY